MAGAWIVGTQSTYERVGHSLFSFCLKLLDSKLQTWILHISTNTLTKGVPYLFVYARMGDRHSKEHKILGSLWKRAAKRLSFFFFFQWSLAANNVLPYSVFFVVFVFFLVCHSFLSFIQHKGKILDLPCIQIWRISKVFWVFQFLWKKNWMNLQHFFSNSQYCEIAHQKTRVFVHWYS
jgi:hypothetical protein